MKKYLKFLLIWAISINHIVYSKKKKINEGFFKVLSTTLGAKIKNHSNDFLKYYLNNQIMYYSNNLSLYNFFNKFENINLVSSSSIKLYGSKMEYDNYEKILQEEDNEENFNNSFFANSEETPKKESSKESFYNFAQLDCLNFEHNKEIIFHKGFAFLFYGRYGNGLNPSAINNGLLVILIVWLGKFLKNLFEKIVNKIGLNFASMNNILFIINFSIFIKIIQLKNKHYKDFYMPYLFKINDYAIAFGFNTTLDWNLLWKLNEKITEIKNETTKENKNDIPEPEVKKPNLIYNIYNPNYSMSNFFSIKLEITLGQNYESFKSMIKFYLDWPSVKSMTFGCVRRCNNFKYNNEVKYLEIADCVKSICIE